MENCENCKSKFWGANVLRQTISVKRKQVQHDFIVPVQTCLDKPPPMSMEVNFLPVAASISFTKSITTWKQGIFTFCYILYLFGYPSYLKFCIPDTSWTNLKGNPACVCAFNTKNIGLKWLLIVVTNKWYNPKSPFLIPSLTNSKLTHIRVTAKDSDGGVKLF